jgi:phosphoserine phosphatase
MYHKIPAGPVAAFDVDDTLVMWEIPENAKEEDLVTIECRGLVQRKYVNKYNLNLLKNMAKSGHAIIVWSKGGSDWAEAVVNSLGIDDLVNTVGGKLTYYIDDIADPSKVLGQHGYYDIHGNRTGKDCPYAERDNNG